MRQFTWLGLGLIAMFVAISFDYHYIDRLAYPFYGVMLLLLVLVIIVGHSGGGSQRWINLGFFRLQPSEPAKLAIVLVMAKYFQSDEPAKGYYLRDLWVPFVMVVPLIILTLIQPDLGTAIILGIVFISMVLMGGLRLRSFSYLVARRYRVFADRLAFSQDLPTQSHPDFSRSRPRPVRRRLSCDPIADRCGIGQAIRQGLVAWHAKPLELSYPSSIPISSSRCFPRSGALLVARYSCCCLSL